MFNLDWTSEFRLLSQSNGNLNQTFLYFSEWITLADQRQILKECWKAFEACVQREKEQQIKQREDPEIQVISDEPMKMKWTAKLRGAMSEILNSFVK